MFDKPHCAFPAAVQNKEQNKLQKAAKFTSLLACTVLLSACFGGDPALKRIDEFTKTQTIDKTKDKWKEHLPKPPLAEFEPESQYFWDLETNKGKITIQLMPKVAPMHVSSTMYLTRLGFYDGIIFHRVIPGFMAQGGDPRGQGTGGPGYKYAGEFNDAPSHDKPGMLSMANSGPNTDGSQFFITFKPTPFLDGKHTIFGEVVQGMETVTALEKLGSRSGKTSEPLSIVKATIRVE
ncbi:MAG: peptidyl-prolyl cis-trans isomerase B (cyclophilin B) [Alteromonadaceae bacterium]|jgi:peptidyl-prolyl cis-trans isomerase B (cyclophilin B)